jgi:hypothetical protein
MLRLLRCRAARTTLRCRAALASASAVAPRIATLCTTAAATHAAKKKPFPIVAGSIYVGTISAVLWMWLDERLDLIKWKTVHYAVHYLHDEASPPQQPGAAPSGFEVSLRARTRPPPIGAMEWPAGRMLLQWALDEARLGDDDTGTVMTIGEGIGVTAIGLALARRQDRRSRAQSSTSPTPTHSSRVVATDFCDESLALLASNAAASGVADDTLLRVRKWDAASGERAVASLPVPLSELSHVIAADVVYHGFGEESDPSGEGLAKTLAALLHAKPSLRVQVMVVDRFSGGAVAALSGAAGVNQSDPAAMSTTVDPAVAAFEASCARLGLRLSKRPVQRPTLDRVRASQWPLARTYWWLAGFYDGIQIYELSVSRSVDTLT